MAGLLNLIPRYLPRFGMAPEWARAARPLVLVFLAIAVTVTLLFHANVDAQGGAYATGVLALMTSAAFAVTISVWKRLLRWPFLFISLIFVYTTIQNVRERPEGIKIASFFIVSIIATSLISRAARSTELRIVGIHLDRKAKDFIAENARRVIRIVARNPDSDEDLSAVEHEVRYFHSLGADEPIYFFEVERGDASDFQDTLSVCGVSVGEHRVFHAKSPVVANAFAALLIRLERMTGEVPHAYFRWTEGNPVVNLLQFIFFGEGDIAPLTHEVLRRAIADPDRRPVICVS